MSATPLSNVVASGASTAQVGPRVTPTGTVPPVAHGGGGQAGSGAQSGTQPANGSTQAAHLATSSVKQVTAQALLTLIQSLGKPLPGATTGTTPALPNNAGASLGVQVQVPTGAGQAGQALTATLTLPKGSPVPLPGTPILVGAESVAGKPQLTVTIQGSAAPSPESMRADAARQGSLAPLMADVAKLSNLTGPNKAVDAALGRLMGFSIDGDVTGQSLRTSIEGARGALQQLSLPGANSPALQQGVQTALGALIRALGLSLPDGPDPSAKGSSLPPTQQPSGQKLEGPSLPTDTRQPTKTAAAPLPVDTPDLTDPAQIQALKTKAEAALSRLNLLQSRMQDGGAQSARADGTPSIRWDVPLMIGQEAALLGVAIEGDGSSPTTEQDHPSHWRFRFAFQSNQHGEVEGLVALQQSAEGQSHQIDIAVWAKKPEILSVLESTRADLVSKLDALDIHTNSLTIASTEAAPRPVVGDAERSRHLVDVRS